MSEETTQPTESENKPAARRHTMLYTLIALLFAVQIAMAAFFFLQDEFPSQDSGEDGAAYDQQIEQMQQQIEVQQKHIEMMGEQIASLGDSSDDTDRFNLQQQTLQELQTQIEVLKQAEQTRAESIGPMAGWKLEQMNQVVGDIRTLKQQVETEGAKRWQDIQLLTAFDRLQEQLLNEQPYDQALTAFRVASESLAQSSAWAEQLRTSALEGVASWQQLQAQFESARSAALQATNGNNAADGEGFWSKIGSNLSQLVQVRKTGPSHQGSDVGSVLARAAFALEQQDAQGVISELSALPEASRTLFAEFEASLNDRQKLLSLIPEIRDYLQARLNKAGE